MNPVLPIAGRLLRACGLAASALLVAANGFANSQVGAWATLATLPFYPVHAHLLPAGKVLIWPGDGGINGDDARVLDPVTQALSPVPKAGYDLFCSGHSFLPDGSLFVAGGHISNNVGLAKASAYDPTANAWRAAPDMNAGRWYPTVTTLANGDALVVSGDIDTTLGTNKLPQVYQRATNSWRSLTSAQLLQALYPRMFLAPDGRVVDVEPDSATRALNTSGTGQWSLVAYRTVAADRGYGSAVMMDGQVMVMGGGDPPLSSAEIIDLNQATPAWRRLPDMSFARRQLNATLLPDGTVLVTGGTSGAGFDNPSTPVFPAEIWNPVTGQWTVMASATVPRLYHSSATLLPDGRVLTTGGNDQMTPEAYSPPYLFKGARPSLASTPAAIGYGQRFTVQTDQAASIGKVTLIRIGSVTHAFDANQRLNTLQFTPGTGTVDITAPASGNVAPPGHYLLFVVNGTGVPSVGAVVQLGGSPPATNPAASITSLTPSSAAAGSPAFTLSVAGSGFASGAVVNWNGSARQTTFGSTAQVSAQIPATDVTTAGTANVTVVNSGAPPSNALPFTITAAPVTPSYRLTVSKTGSEAGRGTITSSPGGISCGSTCAASFASGTAVTLTVRLVGNARFAGWGGACSARGTATTCTVQMTADTAVSANFVRR